MSKIICYDPRAKKMGEYDFFTGDDHLIAIAYELIKFKEGHKSLQDAFETIKWVLNRDVLRIEQN